MELSDLPYDVMHKIVGMLDTSSRSKFSKVSKGCQKVVEDVGMGRTVSSMVVTKYSPCANCKSAAKIKIRVKKTDSESTLEFVGTTVYIEILSWQERRVKKRKIEETGDMLSIVARYFGYIVKTCIKNTMISLKIHVPEFPYRQTSIAKLGNIMYLHLDQNERTKNCLISCGFLKMEQVQNAIYELHVSGVIHELEQLKTLVTTKLSLESRFFTDRFVNEYLKLFVNDQLSRKFRSVILRQPEDDFCFAQVIDGFETVVKQTFLKSTGPSQHGFLVNIAPNVNDSMVCQVTVHHDSTSIELHFFDVQNDVLKRMQIFDNFKDYIFQKTGQTITP